MNLMCLEYYPECGDGGDGCCEWSLKIALAHVRRTFGNRKTIPPYSVVPPIHISRVDFQLYAVWYDKKWKPGRILHRSMLSCVCEGRFHKHAFLGREIG